MAKANKGRRRPWLRFSIVFIALCIVAASATYLATRYQSLRAQFEVHQVRSSAPAGGSYAQALEVLTRTINNHGGDLGFTIEMQNLPSSGSLETIAQIRRGEVDVGLIQGDVVVLNERAPNQAADTHSVFALAKLYDEIFVLFTRDEALTLAELCESFKAEGRTPRFGALGPGSQVYLDLGRLVEFYRCDAPAAAWSVMTYSEAETALNAGQIDVAFMVAGYKQPNIRRLASTPGVHLLNLTQIESFVRNYGGVEPRQIPIGLFGLDAPAAPVETVSTPATLVISDRLERHVIYDLADFIFRHKEQIELAFPQFNIDLPTTRTGAPVHPASVKAHEQQQLNWFVRNAVLLQGALSLIGVLVGVITAIMNGMRFRFDMRREDPDGDGKPG